MEQAERFWSKVVRTDGCWEWSGGHARRPTGDWSYGHVRFDGRAQPVHRVSWQLTYGPIPEGMWVLHHCDNQGCLRPDHLYLGTHADNTRDAIIRRRMAFGERVGNSKLREVDVRAIRALLDAGFTTERIGVFFGVSGRVIRKIRAGEVWKSS